MMMSISASHIKKSFGENRAVDDVSLSIPAGQIFGLVGPDGAGKTTTLRLMVGALKLDAGSVEICGYDVAKQVENARSQIGYLSQRFSMYEDLTVLENIRFFAEVRGLTSKEWLPRSMEILEFVGLANFKDRRAGQLSGGMKQKLGLASALVTRPRVLLLDEPTTGVDPVTRQDFWQLVIKLVSTPIGEKEGDGGTSVIITTPYMDEASRCHRVAFMQRGRIIADGTPSELRTEYNERILELRGQNLNLLRRFAAQDKDVEDVHAFGDRLHLRVRVNTGQAVMKRLPNELNKDGARVDNIRMIRPVLEDVFIALLEQSDESRI
ncbi:MAG: ABC transporter ATP-binding protein [Anaerolineales bacterium]|nr:ABC transporter ATP-binding protein [Anaerolineales bacterium]